MKLFALQGIGIILSKLNKLGEVIFTKLNKQPLRNLNIADVFDVIWMHIAINGCKLKSMRWSNQVIAVI